jgi:hypothetical protein
LPSTLSREIAPSRGPISVAADHAVLSFREAASPHADVSGRYVTLNRRSAQTRHGVQAKSGTKPKHNRCVYRKTHVHPDVVMMKTAKDHV